MTVEIAAYLLMLAFLVFLWQPWSRKPDHAAMEAEEVWRLLHTYTRAEGRGVEVSTHRTNGRSTAQDHARQKERG